MARRIKTQKYPEDKWWVTGEAKAGKSTFARAWLQEILTPPKPDCYIWPTDDRLQEYVQALGENVLVPDVVSFLDVATVSDVIGQDMRSNDMRKVGGFVLDNMTNIFQDATGLEQVKALSGQGGAGAAKKAAIMRVVGSIITKVSMPLIAISHTYTAATQNLKTKRKRDTISEVEEQRLAKNFNAKMEIINENGRYGVKVLECRDRPGMQAFVIWDAPDNFFVGMPQRIREALYDNANTAGNNGKAATPEEPQKWQDFDEQHPFPRDASGAIKTAAVREGLNHYVEHGGQKFFAFGDPDAEVTKQDGTPGTNGAANHAINAYDKIYRGESEYGQPKSAGQMTKFWKDYVEKKIEAAIERHEQRKLQPEPALEEGFSF